MAHLPPSAAASSARPLMRGLSVRLTSEDAPAAASAATEMPSYVADGRVFVRDNLAIAPTGVAMKDSTRTFVVNPETLQFGQVIGRGASSYVQHAIHTPSGLHLALKFVNVFDKSMRTQLTKEIQTLYDADCDCLVTFYGAFYREGAICIALEFMDVGTLTTVLRTVGRVPESVLAGMTFQMLWALAYLRVEKRLHRDLKPSNVLVNSRGQVKLSDFGLSTELKHSLGMAATFTGTCRYMSPERIAHQAYAFPSDVWSLGLLLFECAMGRYPYPELPTYIEMAETIVESPEPRLPMDGTFSPEFLQIVHACLQKDPAARLPADVLLGSTWFANNGVTDVASAAGVVRTWLSDWNAAHAPVGATRSVSATVGTVHPAAAAAARARSADDVDMRDASSSLI